MDMRPTGVFLHDPSAASIVASPIEAGEFSIGGVLPLIGSQVTSCEITCAQPCLPQVYTLTFTDVDFGSCNECGLSVAWFMKLRRQANFDIEDYLHLTSTLELGYEPVQVPSGQVLSTVFRDFFFDLLNNAQYDDEHDWFGITAVKGTDSGGAFPATTSELIITVPCPLQMDIFQSNESQPITVVETTAGQTATYTREQMLKSFPLIIGYVPGQDVDSTFTGCEDVCIITLKGCIDHCVSDAQNLLTTQNAVHLHTAGTKFWYQLVVNSAALGYADFITALNAAVAACNAIPLAPIQGSQVPFTQVIGTGGAVALDLAPFVTSGAFDLTAGPITGTITNGVTTVYFNLTGGGSDIADLAAFLNLQVQGSPFAAALDTLTVDAAWAPTGSVVVIKFTSV
jgi:hypothetical protein